MTEDNWKDFERTGRVSDYLKYIEYKDIEYRNASMKSGDGNGNTHIQGNSTS